MSRGRSRGPGSRPRGGGAAHRVAEEIRHRVSELLLRELRDPRLRGVHLTRVEVSRDLARARLFFRTLPGAATAAEASEGLAAAAPYVRRELGRSMHIRGAPELEFEHDLILEEGERIDELLRGTGPGNPAREAGDGEPD